MGGRTLDEALKQAPKLGTAKAIARLAARLRWQGLDSLKNHGSQKPWAALWGDPETVPVLKVLTELTLGRHPMRTWMFITEITDKLILGLDILEAQARPWIWHTLCRN
jgi:hypothetical protein